MLKTVFGKRIEEESKPSEAPKHHLCGCARVVEASLALRRGIMYS